MVISNLFKRVNHFSMLKEILHYYSILNNDKFFNYYSNYLKNYINNIIKNCFENYTNNNF